MHCNCNLLNCFLIGSFLPLVYFSCIIKFQQAFRNSFCIPSRQFFQSEAPAPLVTQEIVLGELRRWLLGTYVLPAITNNDSNTIKHSNRSLSFPSTITYSKSFDNSFLKQVLFPFTTGNRG